MGIRPKFIFLVLPLIIVAVVLAGVSSYFVAAQAVTKVATQFLAFKAYELEKYADGQWKLLVENGVTESPNMVAAAKEAVITFASSVVRSPTEAILALGPSGSITMSATLKGDPVLPPLPGETPLLMAMAGAAERGFKTIKLGGTTRVAQAFPFPPFGWEVLVTEERASFYGEVESIARRSLIILLVSVVVAILLLLWFTTYLTSPLVEVVAAMRRIIASNNLAERVPVHFDDEIGQLSHTFNLMLGALDEAREQIMKFALDAAIAQKREMKTRNVFQLYVPKDVIEEIFKNPEKMLEGDDRVVSILFSDIRSFTTISEGMRPDELVRALNRYFAAMVDVIMDRGGVVDKYIGDAIMAIFGAPVRHEDDALQSVYAGLAMTKALEAFNEVQRKSKAKEFHIGVGINYGIVTVGNIGCDKKMNYTVIGDAVNLASRLEGQTKFYRQPILISESVQRKVKDILPCRMMGKLQVKGKTQGVKVFTVRETLDSSETETWAIWAKAMDLFYGRDFVGARKGFESVLARDPSDAPAIHLLEAASDFIKAPPPPSWDGSEILTEK